MKHDDYLPVRLGEEVKAELERMAALAGYFRGGKANTSRLIREYLEAAQGLTPEELRDAVEIARLCYGKGIDLFQRLGQLDQEELQRKIAERHYGVATVGSLKLDVEGISAGGRYLLRQADDSTLWGLWRYALSLPLPEVEEDTSEG